MRSATAGEPGICTAQQRRSEDGTLVHSRRGLAPRLRARVEELFRRFLRGHLEDQDIRVLTMLAEGATIEDVYAAEVALTQRTYAAEEVAT